MTARVSLPLTHGLGKMGSAIERDDTNLMTHLVVDGDKSRSLNNLGIVIVGGRSGRGPGALQDQTPFEQRAVLRAIELMAPICRLPFGLSLLCAGREWRNPAVPGINDQRRSQRFDDLRPTVPPEIVIRSLDVSLCPAVTSVHVRSLDHVFLVLRRFLFREEFLSSKLGGPFERRDRGEIPDALNVRSARGAKTRWSRLTCSRGGQRDGTKQENEDSTVHRLTPHPTCHVLASPWRLRASSRAPRMIVQVRRTFKRMDRLDELMNGFG